MGTDLLEDEALRRALAGSDKLLMFLLQRRRPEVWALPKANRPEGFARSHDAGRNIDTKFLSVEEADARIKALGLPIPDSMETTRRWRLSETRCSSRTKPIIRECVGRGGRPGHREQ